MLDEELELCGFEVRCERLRSLVWRGSCLAFSRVCFECFVGGWDDGWEDGTLAILLSPGALPGAGQRRRAAAHETPSREPRGSSLNKQQRVHGVLCFSIRKERIRLLRLLRQARLERWHMAFTILRAGCLRAERACVYISTLTSALALKKTSFHSAAGSEAYVTAPPAPNVTSLPESVAVRMTTEKSAAPSKPIQPRMPE